MIMRDQITNHKSSSNGKYFNLWTVQYICQWTGHSNTESKHKKTSVQTVWSNDSDYACNGREILTELIVSVQKRYDMSSFGEWTCWVIGPRKYCNAPIFAMGIWEISILRMESYPTSQHLKLSIITQWVLIVHDEYSNFLLRQYRQCNRQNTIRIHGLHN